MKIALKSFKNGKVLLENAPVPSISNNEVLIKNLYSVISPGTEKMLLDFGRSNLLSKILKEPERVKEVLNKVSSDGLKATYKSVNTKLDEWTPMGYSSFGEVIESKTKEFKVGDFVISNGPHSEYVAVNKNLCALVPKKVSQIESSFTVIASVALQAIRLAKPNQGETFVVYGLGLIGLILVQLLRANGCKVMGVDINEKRLNLAKKFGAYTHNNLTEASLINSSLNFSKNMGVDGVFLTLSSKSDKPVSEAAQMCRKRGRVILTGVTGLNLKRQDFYEKEISFRVSSSYGPGRYDPIYEDKGLDYPYGYVRWTEKRNFEAILDLLSENMISFKDLVSKEYSFESIEDAFEDLMENDSLGIVLRYSAESNNLSKTVQINQKKRQKNEIKKVSIGLIGAGSHCQKSILPFLSNRKANLEYLVGNRGISLAKTAKKFNFNKISTDINDVFNQTNINSIIISTRHNSHADLALKAIQQNKNVFVEKPLSLTLDELNKIEDNLPDYSGIFFLGFNRRFSPPILKIKSLLNNIDSPKSFVYTINAGRLNKDSWIKDEKIGGGRLISEVCHFLDLLVFLTDEKIIDFSINSLENDLDDCFVLSLKFSNGSLGSINYFSNGHDRVSKENLKIFTDGKYLELHNFLSIKGKGWKNFSSKIFFGQQKGHKECINNFISTIEKGLSSTMKLEDIFHVSELSIKINDALKK